jgi:hypothetical protein
MQSVMDKHHLSANKGRLLQHKERLLQHKGRLLRNKEQAKESHGTPLYVISMSLVCRLYVVFMSFLCHLLILQSSEIELNTTNLCHMSLVFMISHTFSEFPH